jgi:Ca2+/Na+ antiporter
VIEMRMKTLIKEMKFRWVEASGLVIVLLTAAIITLIKPFQHETISYFADVTTPLLLIFAVLFIVVGYRRRVPL